MIDRPTPPIVVVVLVVVVVVVLVLVLREPLLVDYYSISIKVPKDIIDSDLDIQDCMPVHQPIRCENTEKFVN